MNAPSEVSQKLLCKQYLRKSDDCSVCEFCGQRHETLDELFDRVSFGVPEYREILAAFDFLPGSPAIFNAGGNGTLSACFKFDVQDTMESILDVATKSALVQKWGGGVGYCFSELRQKGAPIRSTHGKACGSISVMRLYQAVTEMITQGGKREGAQIAILHCDHPDIEEFIHCKDVEGILNTFNVSVAVTNKFMNRVADGMQRETALFAAIVKGTWRNGEPGIYFIDRAEEANPSPVLGKLTGTNPCGEVPLLDNESCNLGSINLAHFVTPDLKHIGYGYFEFERLRKVVRLATRYLDRVIEENFYPVDEIKEATLRTRKLGLGVMGWADALALMGISYDSQEAVDLAGNVMECIQETAHSESEGLAENYGVCDAFEVGTSCPGDVFPQRRNACLTCIAPTGSISTLANCSSGIEPHYSLEYTQIMGDGTALKRKVDFGKFVPKVADEIGWEWHVKHQAAFQEFTDLAVSKTINMPNSATEKDIAEAYMLAWKLGCKGITVYREGSRIQQAIYKGKLESYPTDATTVKERRKLAKDGVSLRHKFDVGDMEGYLHIGVFPDDTPGELFITGVKEGSTISGLLDGIAILTSLALQYGVPLEVMVSKLQGTRFEPSGLTSNQNIPTTSSLLDYIFRYVQLRCNGKSLEKLEHSGMVCPNCGATVIFQEGCSSCSAKCGWSRC